MCLLTVGVSLTRVTPLPTVVATGVRVRVSPWSYPDVRSPETSLPGVPCSAPSPWTRLGLLLSEPSFFLPLQELFVSLHGPRPTPRHPPPPSQTPTTPGSIPTTASVTSPPPSPLPLLRSSVGGSRHRPRVLPGWTRVAVAWDPGPSRSARTGPRRRGRPTSPWAVGGPPVLTLCPSRGGGDVRDSNPHFGTTPDPPSTPRPLRSR